MDHELKLLAEEFVKGRTSLEYFAWHLVRTVALYSENRTAMTRLAQAIFYIAPPAGDG